tara:strand:+ start:12711 stop:13799 length:1089 start_codon:yes stop_codon:yes gene_type:complete
VVDMAKIITEGKVKILIPSQGNRPIKSSAFYNPKMKLNRDLSMAVAREFFKNRASVKICEPFAATGIRAIRYAKELVSTSNLQPQTPNLFVYAGDIRSSAIEMVEKNAKLNKVKIETFRGDANELLTARKYDLIDLDPFGTPAIFVDSALKGLKANGLLCATATDMMALCGVAPKAGTEMQKYDGAKAIKCEFVHEVAVRLLLGLIARKSKRVMKPLLSLSTDHYIRVFVKFGNLTPHTPHPTPIQKNIGYVNYNPKTGKRSLSKTPKTGYKHAGPLWIGKLWNKPFIGNLLRGTGAKERRGADKKLVKILETIYEECNGQPLYSSVRELYKGKQQPKLSEVMKKFKATRTHFKDQGVRLKA